MIDDITSARGRGVLAGGMPPATDGERLPRPLTLYPLSMDCSADSPSGFSLSKIMNRIVYRLLLFCLNQL